MKLYNATFSPYCIRVRAVIKHKRAPIQVVDPPGGLRSEEFKRLVPTGKVPSLELDSGTILSESIALIEYLDDRFPDPPLKPAKAENRARMRQITQMADHYFAPAYAVLFGAIRSKAAPPDLEASLARAHEVLEQIARVAAPRDLLLGPDPTLADYALASHVWLYQRMPGVFGHATPALPKRMADWWESARSLPALSAEWAPVHKALSAWIESMGLDASKLSAPD
jgi:glutathione S-transferase